MMVFFCDVFFFLNDSHKERQISEILSLVQVISSGLSADHVIYDNIVRVPEHSWLFIYTWNCAIIYFNVPTYNLTYL